MNARQKTSTGAVLLLSFSLAGCGTRQDAQNPRGERGTAAAAPAVGQTDVIPVPGDAPDRRISDNAPPEQVVAAFLDALRTGDEVTAARLLTDTAREETAKHNLDVQPPGSPTATFEVGQVETIGDAKDGAHVHSTWTEKDPNDIALTYEIVWILRRQPNGWRVAGMATFVDSQQTPLVLNFENPEDMLLKWREADPELAAESTPQQPQQAQEPDADGGALLR